jgi:type III secretion protein J
LRWLRLPKAIIVVGLALLLNACVTHELQTGLTEHEAQEIVILLHENGIDAYALKAAGEKKGEDKWTVSIRGGDQNLAHAWAVLHENGLPQEKDKSLEDVFANSGMIPTATEEKARLLMGISGEINRTLKSVSGVVDARVLVVMPDTSPLLDRSDRVPPTASVLIKYRGRDLPLSEDDVKRLVARAVEGLQPENVAVVYKKVEPIPTPDRSLYPVLGNQEFLLGALVLLAITSAGCIGLVAKARWQRSKVESLEDELERLNQRVASQQQLAANSASAPAARAN